MCRRWSGGRGGWSREGSGRAAGWPAAVTGSVEVAHEKVAEFLRVAERGAMTAGNLVGDGAQAFLCQPPHERGGEELVVLAQDEIWWRGPPRPGRPWGI